MNLTEESFTRVTTDGNALDHVVRYVVFFDGSGKSLCGKGVWPDSWTLAPEGAKKLCVGCVQALQRSK